MATIMDIMRYSDTETTLSIITMLSRYQATLSKLKEDLDSEKKRTTELQDKVTKLEENMTQLLKHNTNMEMLKKEIEDNLNKNIASLYDELYVEKNN